MNKLLIIQFFAVYLLVSGCGHFTDGKRFGNQKIKEIKIGNQIWMAENLNVERYRNGDRIAQAEDGREWLSLNRTKTGGYYNENKSRQKKYGKLYNTHVLDDPRGIAPKGWRVPSNEDWEELIEFLGEGASNKLKSKKGWFEYGDRNANGTNESGFNALPAGYVANGMGIQGEDNAFFWSSTSWTEVGPSPAYYYVSIHAFGPPDSTPTIVQKANIDGFAIRCIKN